MTSLSDKAGFLIVANFIKYAVGFVLPIVLVRMLSQSEYGTYQQMILIGTAAIGIMSLGLPTSVYYFYHLPPPERTPALIVQTSLLLAIAGAVATAAICFGAIPLADSVNNPSMAGLLKIYALSIAFMIASEHSVHFMIAQDRYLLAVGFETVESFVRVLVLLAPLWLGYGFAGLIVGLVLYAIARFVVRTAYLFGSGGMSFAGWPRFLFPAEQLAYSVPIALVSLTGLIGNTFNRGIVAASFTPEHYAIYSVGALEIPLDVIFQASVANVLRASLPSLVRDGNLVEVVRIVREAVRKLSIIVLPSFIFLFGHSHQFITLMFTQLYVESVPVFQIYLWLVPLHMFMLSPIPQIFGNTRLNLYIVLAMTAVLLFLSYALLKWVGFYGPALAVVASQYFGVAVYFFFVLRLTRTTLLRLLPLPGMLRVVAASLGALAVARITADLTASALLNFILAGAAFSAVFFLLGALIGVFTPDDRRLIRRWISKMLPTGMG